ncbi:TonB-dependent receptor [Persicitalea jodogahamensis]|uniref:SusC/RagA family TonB-linked outer membrane protein n=1 Tax=Persicitalea jodogahamensis TaxID=402147 RepID=A0A8J3G7D1_9BACT|nr:TonB-dependent receptor [Persicitalea jodogahamensis]GHB54284.1 SusC/RagA family TonB-linked outer membrane protein [Persicitalea jodogahamensis]
MKKQLRARKLLQRIMRITLLQTILTGLTLTLCYAHEAHTQGLLDRAVSVKANNVELRKVLSRIENEVSVKFVYSSTVIQPDRRVSVKAEQRKLSEVLAQILQPLDISYRVIGGQIMLTRLGAEPSSLWPTLHVEEAAERRVTGTVRDENGGTLPGVSVVLKGTQRGTTTDTDGKFALEVPDESSVLVFSFVGYSSQEVTVGTQSSLSISLVPESKALNEVVVIGYGSVKRKDLTGAVSQIDTKDIDAFPVSDVQQALRGRAPGVRVIQSSGQPGASVQVQVRGGNSFLGNNNPLYVVDGFPLTGGISFLNPSDIATMDILKDASATAIYGARGANGVVIITTRQGKEGRSRVSLDSYYGFQNAAKRFDLLNPQQYAEVANEQLTNDGKPAQFTGSDFANTDWQDEIFQTAPIQNHVLTFSGGNEKTRYSVSGNFFKQEGIILNSGTDRGSFRFGLNQNVSDRFSFSTHFVGSRFTLNNSRANNGSRGNNILSSAIVSPPTVPVRDSNGNYPNVAPYSFSPNVLQHPLLYAEILDQSKRTSLLADFSATLTILEGLTFKTLFGTEQAFDERNFYSPTTLKLSSANGNASSSFGRDVSFLNENILSYTRAFNQSTLNAVAGFTWQNQNSYDNSQGGSGFLNDILQNNNLGAAEVTNPNSSNYSEWALLSWLGRVNYSLADKFLFTVSARADGSSRFGANNKWGFFPSGAIAYKLSEEAFIKSIKAISTLKLRLSYGTTGSTTLSPFQSLNRLGVQRATFGKTDLIGYTPIALPNDNLKWETTAQFDVGLDAGLFNERLRITFDYYRKSTTDLLARVTLPGSTGFGSITTNLGEIQNAGVELGIGADIVDRAFKWDVFAQMSTNKNKVIDIGGSDIFGGGINLPFGSAINIAREGQPLGLFYGFKEDGLDEKGQIKYLDLNNDGAITNSDQTIIGNPYPDFIFSLNNNLNFKNFELNVFLEGVQGNDLFFGTGGSISNSFNSGENQLVDVYNNRWRPDSPDPNALYPKLSTTSAFRVSDRFIKNASYLRIKNVRLAYNLPITSLGVKWIQSIQLYASAQNLLTITKYPGLDPEVNTRSSTGDLRIGIDETGYPAARTLTFGLKAGF